MRQSKRLGYLIDIEYVGKRGRAMLKFFDPIQQELFVWYDNTGHLSYLITDAPGEKIEKLLSGDEEYRGWIDIERYDAVLDKTVTLRKVFAETPLAIGGQRRYSRARNFRSILETGGCGVWEAWIRYQNGYCYDLNFEMGMPYIVTEREITPFFDENAGEKMKETVSKLRESGVEITDMIRYWVRLFETPLPRLNILSLDIEVLPERPETMPNAFIAGQEVTAVGLVGTNGLNKVLVLKREGIPMGELKDDIEVVFFDSERNLLLEVFRIMREYPFVVTFNGDNFDLMYLYNRAKRFNISPSYNPIYIVNKICKITNAMHIDLYTFLKIPSIQGYAFSGKYKDFSLDDISTALLGEGKIKFDEFIGDLPLYKLAEYCHTDARITLKLMTFNDHTTTGLILMLMRMSNLSPYQVTRSRIGEWIKSTFFSLLRRNKILIPNQQQLQGKGQIQTTSLIKGKKYQGAIVWEPIPGIFFKVVVVDFASLYPTEVKERNIGYGSINCDHPECMSNIVPDTTHHICIKNRALEADVIGGLRDVRVFIYKPLGKTNSYYYTLQQAIKVYLNASYGVFGNEGFGLYCPPVAEAITAYSRRDMMAVVNKSKEMDIVVLGGDTDSVFLYEPTIEETTKLQQWTRMELNLDLGVDKVYRYAIFSKRKKNYLGIFENGTADMKGLTGKKRHIPTIIKDRFSLVVKLLGGVYNMDDYEKTKQQILDIIMGLQLTINNRSWEKNEDLAFHVRLGKNVDQYDTNPQHVKIAKMLIAEGYPVKGGDSMSFLKSTTEEGVMPTKIAKRELVNVDKYLKQVQSVFEQIVEPMELDITVERMGEGKLVRPTSLSYFMIPKTLNTNIDTNG